MEFWCAEVKPGKPYTHSAKKHSNRVLHISTVILAIDPPKPPEGIVLVQFNIGGKSPFYLCALSLEASPSFSVNADFKEMDDVMFSVHGPCGVYLVGHYLSLRRNGIKFEPSGECIAIESDKEKSGSDEDNYEDCFIDDAEVIQCVKTNLKKRKTNYSRKCQIIISDTDSQELIGSPMKEKKNMYGSASDCTSNGFELEKEKTGILEDDISNGGRERDESELKKKKKKSSVLLEGTSNGSKDSELENVITGTSESDKSNRGREIYDSEGKTVNEAYLDGLNVETLIEKSEGKEAVEGKKVKLKYHGKIKESGELFEEVSRKKIMLGKGSVVKGLEKGIEGMKVGERRRMTVPPSLGYGEHGNGHSVPPNSWLIYEVDLLKVI